MDVVRAKECRMQQEEFRKMIPQFPYREPQILKKVLDIPEVLAKADIHHVMLVTDKGILAAGLVEELFKGLAAAGIVYSLYDGTTPNPTIDQVEKAREQYLKEGCEAIIAFGGGSAMDCAKAMGARLADPHLSIEEMVGFYPAQNMLPLLITIPTTAGTGSETTITAVITDDKTHRKYTLISFTMIPQYAVLDATVTLGLPPHITATTGMDALTHAVEAYLGGFNTDFTREMAEDAVGRIHQYLKRAYDKGDDLEARDQMLLASYHAGAAFTRALVGYVHAIAHSLGGKYGMAHGLANAIILPYVLEAYGESCYESLGALARKTGIAEAQAEDKTAAEQFIAWVKEMNASMNIPQKVDCIREEDIPELAGFADEEANPFYPVPKLMDAKELEQLYHVISQ